MIGWIQVTLAAASAGIIVLLLIMLFQRFFCPKKRRQFEEDQEHREIVENLQTGIARLHHVHTVHHQLDKDNSRRRTNYYVFRRGASSRPLFSWQDHPSLIADAVENGWSRFAFTTHMSSPSLRSSRSLLGVCAAGNQGTGREIGLEISWEVCQGSADFMQKIRLNSGLKKMINNNTSSMGGAGAGALSMIRTALPLPGPPLGNSAFPQEGYFEITILSSSHEDDNNSFVGNKVKSEGEKAKLIQENSNPKANSESLIHVTGSSHSHGNGKLEELKLGGGAGSGGGGKDGGGGGGVVVLSLGLSVGGSLPLKLPGSFAGSIGFNSDGSVYLDGIKLVFESEREEWERKNKVIGCGYNPRERKVFFTVDSELVHVIHCKAEEFGTPLYPTLAANSDIMIIVNFGQSPFQYAPANAQRTPNPCFIGPPGANSPALGFEDSKELFSMGRIDSKWLNRSATRNTNNSVNIGSEFDVESEGDLFEIVLDSCGRSPNPISL